MKRSWIAAGTVVAVALAALIGVKAPPELAQVLNLAGITLPPELIQREDAPAPALVQTEGLPDTAGSFGTAKNWLYDKVFHDIRRTFYCGCAYDENRRVDWKSCGYKIREDNVRAARVEAEHVVPAYWIGYTRPCWRTLVCSTNNGERFKGRDCCQDIDPVFRAAHNDLHNLRPAVGEINGDRSNYRFGMVQTDAREYGDCVFKVDTELRRAEPPPQVRGDIARISFYMEKTYGVRLSRQQRQLFEVWHRQDPPDAWEKDYNRRIKAIQGNGNPFVEGG